MKTNYLRCTYCKLYVPATHSAAVQFRAEHSECMFHPSFTYDPYYERGLAYAEPGEDYTCVLSPLEQLCEVVVDV